MKKSKRNKIIGLIAICINALLVFAPLRLLYLYNFTNLLFLVMYPTWVLLINALLGIIGIYISILLCKGKTGIKPFLIATLAIWSITFASYVFWIMY